MQLSTAHANVCCSGSCQRFDIRTHFGSAVHTGKLFIDCVLFAAWRHIALLREYDYITVRNRKSAALA